MPHVADSASEVRVRVERPTLPLLWVDTSLLIGVVRFQQGKDNADDRIGDFLELLQSKRSQGKLLCVRSAQAVEVEGHPGAADIRRALEDLTYGVGIRSRAELDWRQITRAMEAFVAGGTEIVLGAQDFLTRDPQTRMEEVRADGWWLFVDADAPREIRERGKRSKAELSANLEEIRKRNVANGVTFEAQLDEEAIGFLKGHVAIAERLKAQLASPSPDWLTVANGAPVLAYARAWQKLGRNVDDLADFFKSPHYRALPCADIGGRLYAQLLTSSRCIETGDAMDIEHMVSALPVARWVLTDRWP